MCLPGEFSSSDFVTRTTGVDCVCERSAAMAGKLLAKKKTGEGVTLAVALLERTPRERGDIYCDETGKIYSAGHGPQGD